MWQYLSPPTPNELYHYGVLGMKWGIRRYQNKDGTLTPAGKKRYNRDVQRSQRKLDRLAGRVKEQQAKRAEIRSTKGVGSKAYSKASKKLNLTRARLDLQKAKNEGDATGKILAKNRIKDAKLVKKYGAAGRVSSEMKRIFGSTLSKRELDAISVTEWKSMIGRERTNKILKNIGRVALPVLSAAAIAEGKYYVQNGKLGIPSPSFEGGQIGVKVR